MPALLYAVALRLPRSEKQTAPRACRYLVIFAENLHFTVGDAYDLIIRAPAAPVCLKLAPDIYVKTAVIQLKVVFADAVGRTVSFCVFDFQACHLRLRYFSICN